jgi:hypothetical protein
MAIHADDAGSGALQQSGPYVPTTMPLTDPSVRSRATALNVSLGFWGAVLSATFALLFGIGVVLSLLLYPGREWQGVEYWAATYSLGAMYLTVLPSFFLTFAFVVLMASVHVLAREDGKVLSLVGLSLALLYAAILNANYFLQLTFVRHHVLDGRGAMVGLLAMEDMSLSSLFWTLEYLGYGLQCLAALAIAPLFSGWTRWFLLLTGAAGVLSLVTPVLELPLLAFVIGGAGWQVGLPASAILLARHFHRLAYAPLQPGGSTQPGRNESM